MDGSNHIGDGPSAPGIRERTEACRKRYELPLTKKDILRCLSYWPEDEEIAIRLLNHIVRLEKRVSELEQNAR